MAEARRMASADGGRWNAAEITRIFNDRGIDVRYGTVLRWVSPKVERTQRKIQQNYRARRRRGRLGSDRASEATKVERVLALRQLDIPWVMIARLVELDFGERIDPQVLADDIRRRRPWPSHRAVRVVHGDEEGAQAA